MLKDIITVLIIDWSLSIGAGAILFENAQKVNWTDVRESVPIFLVTALVPFTYSLFYGVLCGMCMYIVFRLCSANFWRKYAPPQVLACVSACYSFVCCLGQDADRGSGLYDHLTDDFGLSDARAADDDDDNKSEPLFFDNPYFDFQPAAPGDYHSDDGSEFFGVSLRPLHHPLDSGEDYDYTDIHEDDSAATRDESESWYHGVPLDS